MSKIIYYTCNYTKEDFQTFLKDLENNIKKELPRKSLLPTIKELEYISNQQKGTYITKSGLYIGVVAAKEMLKSLKNIKQ